MLGSEVSSWVPCCVKMAYGWSGAMAAVREDADAASSGGWAPHLRVNDLDLPDPQRRLRFLPLLREDVCQALRPHLAERPPSLRLGSVPPEQGEVDVAIGQVRLEGDGPEDVHVDLHRRG